MSESSWRNIAASGVSSVKGFLAQKDFKQIPGQIQQFANSRSENGGWREWAGQRLGAIKSLNNASVSTEKVALFPAGQLDGITIPLVYQASPDHLMRVSHFQLSDV
jgi:hypothetical protein